MTPPGCRKQAGPEFSPSRLDTLCSLRPVQPVVIVQTRVPPQSLGDGSARSNAAAAKNRNNSFSTNTFSLHISREVMLGVFHKTLKNDQLFKKISFFHDINYCPYFSVWRNPLFLCNLINPARLCFPFSTNKPLSS